MLIKKTYKVRLYPNETQKGEMVKILGGCRFVWNHFLNLRKNYYLEHKKTIPYAEMSRQLTKLRKTAPELEGIQLMPLTQELRRLDKAYNHFFRKEKRFPKFKNEYRNKQSFCKEKDWRLLNGKVKLQKNLVLKCRGTLPTDTDKIGSIIVSCIARDIWYASIFTQKIDTSVATAPAIGIDVGLTTLATTSDGKKYNGRPNTSWKRIAFLQKKLIRQEIGSKRRAETRRQIARVYHMASNARLDHIHKTTDAILKERPSLVAIETLSVSNMVKNHRLAKSIVHASWHEFLRQIRYKTEWRGGKVVEIDRFYPSSKTCSNCFYVADSLPLNIREWDCPQCEMHHDRDINAAKVILQQGQGMPRVETPKGLSVKRNRHKAIPMGER